MDQKIKRPFSRKSNKVNTIEIIFLLLFLVITTLGFSQEKRIAGIHYTNFLTSSIKSDLDNAEMAFQEFGVFFNLPSKLKNNKTILIHGVGYGFVEAQMTNFPIFTNKVATFTLQELYYRLSLVHRWNEKWDTFFNIMPTIASDFSAGLTRDDLLFQGAILLNRSFHSGWKVGGGLAYSARLGEPRVLPLLHFKYEKKRHEVTALLPIQLQYTYALFTEKKLKLGVLYNRNGANFNVQQPILSDVDKIIYTRANMGIHLSYPICNNLKIETFSGWSTDRKYSFLYNDTTKYDFNSNTAPFFHVGIVLKPEK